MVWDQSFVLAIEQSKAIAKALISNQLVSYVDASPTDDGFGAVAIHFEDGTEIEFRLFDRAATGGEFPVNEISWMLFQGVVRSGDEEQDFEQGLSEKTLLDARNRSGVELPVGNPDNIRDVLGILWNPNKKKGEIVHRPFKLAVQLEKEVIAREFEYSPLLTGDRERAESEAASYLGELERIESERLKN